MQLRLAAALLFVTACKFPLPPDVADDDTRVDASRTDATTDATTAPCVASTITCNDALGDYVACSAAGTPDVVMHCPLGCAPDEEKCLDIDPHNGLAMYLDMVPSPPDITLTGPVIINTVSGVVLDHGLGTVLPTFVQQGPDGSSMRVFVVHDFTLEGALTIPTAVPTDPRHEPALAIVATGSIRIHGPIDAAARGVTPGPGGHVPGVADSPPCRGADVFASPPAASQGGSGGGGATPGGTGGAVNGSAANPAGTARVAIEPLDGGCYGGSVFHSTDGAIVASGGAGGGAIQLSARELIEISGAGRIDASGAGGGVALRMGGGGGGAGGVVLLEAPQVLLDGPNVVVSTKGGGGGGGSTTSLGTVGGDGGTNAAAATGGSSPGQASGGRGGADLPPTGGDFYQASMGGGGGGGGGASGMTAVFTMVGAIAPQNGAAIRGSLATDRMRTRRLP
jgi:hypothetical protein